MKDLFIKFVTWSSNFNWPLSHKQFDIKDVSKIEKYLEDNEIKFAVLLVSTKGALSNFWIRLSYLFGSEKKKFSKYTHAVGYWGKKDCRHYVVEAIGTGVETMRLGESISQRDSVGLFIVKNVANPILEKMHNHLDRIAKRDNDKNVTYDFEHNAEDHQEYDCSEVIFDCVNSAFRESDQIAPLKTIKRLGMKTFSPIDIEQSDLFEVVYDNKEGFR